MTHFFGSNGGKNSLQLLYDVTKGLLLVSHQAFLVFVIMIMIKIKLPVQ